MSGDESQTQPVKMDGYYQEKATNSLRNLVYVIESLNREKNNLPSQLFSELQGGIIVAMHNLTNVVAGLAGSLDKHDWHDHELIIEKGQQGLEEVLFKYGCITEPEHIRRERNRTGFIQRIIDLSELEAREARTAIYDEVAAFGLYDSLSKNVIDLIEPVTNEVKSWGQFQQEIKQLLQPLISNNTQ